MVIYYQFMDVELFIYELKFLKRRIIEIQRINRRDIRILQNFQKFRLSSFVHNIKITAS
jgi:hypothetical protein